MASEHKTDWARITNKEFLDEASTVTLLRLISLKKVSDITSLSRSGIYRLIDAGELRPVKLGKKIAFVESEVLAWLDSKLASRGV